MHAAASLFWLASSPAPEPATPPSLAVETQWLADHLNEPDLTVVAVGRTPDRFVAGHLPGAVYLDWRFIAAPREGLENELPPLDELAAGLTALGLGDRGPIVLYSENRNLLAARAFLALDFAGHGARCALLDGGQEAWVAEGWPLETGASHPTPQPFTPQPRPEVLIARDEVAAAAAALNGSADRRQVLLDARPEGQYSGQEAGGGVLRAGHIPGAVHLYWETLFSDPVQPRLRPLAELRAQFEALKIGPDATITHYCRSGVQASYTYYVARLLGYASRLYDGSFMDWSRAEGTPIATGASE